MAVDEMIDEAKISYDIQNYLNLELFIYNLWTKTNDFFHHLNIKQKIVK